MNVNDLLDAAKVGAAVTSDYALAEALGVAKQSVSRYRHAVAYPEPVVCEKLAVFSGIPLHRVLGIVGEARAISAEEKRVWRKLAAAMFVGLLVTFPAAARADFPTNGHASETPGVGIMRNVRRFLRQLHAVAGRLNRRRGAAYAPPVLA